MVKCLPITSCHECKNNVLGRRDIPLTAEQFNQYLKFPDRNYGMISVFISPDGAFIEKDYSYCAIAHKETLGKIPDWCPLKDVKE